MKTSQFVLLLAVLAIGQIVGFGLVLGKLQAPESSTNSQQSHPQMQTAAALVRPAHSAVDSTSGLSTSAPHNSGGAPQPAPSAQKDLQRRAADAGDSIAVADTASTHHIAEAPVTTPGLDPALVAAAMQESNAIVQRALSAGQWTAADYAAIRPHLSSLPPAERLQIVLKVHRALERREITRERGVPPPM